uniref:Uncharacterized protein n=1 Tax=Noccaea caerulescens TaxID=107243 RepID=A0A1J3IZ67_NOCCA
MFRDSIGKPFKPLVDPRTSRREIQLIQESNQQEKAETGRQETTSGLKEETFHITSMDLQWMQHEPPPHLGTNRLPSVTLVKCNQSGSKRTSLGFTSPSDSYQTEPENYAASDSVEKSLGKCMPRHGGSRTETEYKHNTSKGERNETNSIFNLL